jgi:hypothetical protein
MVDIYLYMPKISRNNFVPGQRSTIAGMWYCKGRLGERNFEKNKTTKKGGFVKTLNSNAKKLISDLSACKKEFCRIQDLYVKMGIDPKKYNANYELQINLDPNQGYILYGYRANNKVYYGKSLQDVCMRYRIDLELMIFKGLSIEE